MNRFGSVRVWLATERTEDEVMAELHELYSRARLVHDLASLLTRKIEQISPDIAKWKEKDAEKILRKLPEEALSLALKEKGRWDTIRGS